MTLKTPNGTDKGKAMTTAKAGNMTRSFSTLRFATVITGMLTLAACASTALPPSESLLAAELAISNAEQAGVADYASVELTAARKKMANANAAVQNGKMEEAQRFAEQARADADLAAAKAEFAKTQEVNNDMLKSMTTLKQEMQRNSGATE